MKHKGRAWLVKIKNTIVLRARMKNYRKMWQILLANLYNYHVKVLALIIYLYNVTYRYIFLYSIFYIGA